MTIAQNKNNHIDQQSLLNDTWNSINECVRIEDQMLEQAKQDSIYILSELQIKTHENKDSHYPFNHLYKPQFIEETNRMRTPILLGRGKDWICLKIGSFNPKQYADSLQKQIKSTAIFGKESMNKVDVS